MTDTFGLNEAVSQANALTSSVQEHNDLVRARNTDLQTALNQNLSKIKGAKKTAQAQEKIDQVLHGVETSYGGANALYGGYKEIGDIRAQGTGNYFSRQTAIAKSRLQRITGQTPDQIPEPQTQVQSRRQAFLQEDTSAPEPVLRSAPAEAPSGQGTAPVEAPSGQGTATSGQTAGTAEPTPSSNVGEASTTSNAKLVSDTEGEKMLGGLSKAKGLYEAGSKAMAVGNAGYDIFEDFKDKGIAGDNTADKISNVAGIASGALDVASMFLPFLAPVAAVAGVVGGVSGLVGEEQDKAKGEDAVGQLSQQAQQLKQNTLKQENANKMISSAGLQSGGFIASAQQDNRMSIVPTGSF
jgi:hypothetical protein